MVTYPIGTISEQLACRRNINPNEEQLEQLYDVLEWTWGRREITFCDPMSGGGSIPFEALRYGLTVHVNELNPVASVVLKATLDYPARFGSSLVDNIRKHGDTWCNRVRERLEPFFPLSTPDENIFCYLWARTIACPETGKPVPLSPNWWLRKGGDPIAVKIVADPSEERCRFEIVLGATACKKINPDKGTVKRGTGISPWTGDTIEGDYIKAEAQAGRMGQQLYAIGVKTASSFIFRPPTPLDEVAVDRAEKEVARRWASWEAKGLIPEEPRWEGRADWACEIYGARLWRDTYSSRQLLSMITLTEELQAVVALAQGELHGSMLDAVTTGLALTVSKAAAHNSRQSWWDGGRLKIVNAFARHDLSMKWSFSEFDASRKILPWSLEQIIDATNSLAALAPVKDGQLFSPGLPNPVERLSISNGPAQSMRWLGDQSISLITVDPPYYDNVMYAECSNFFYVWMKRTLSAQFPDLFSTISRMTKTKP